MSKVGDASSGLDFWPSWQHSGSILFNSKVRCLQACSRHSRVIISLARCSHPHLRLGSVAGNPGGLQPAVHPHSRRCWPQAASEVHTGQVGSQLPCQALHQANAFAVRCLAYMMVRAQYCAFPWGMFLRERPTSPYQRGKSILVSASAQGQSVRY